MAEMMARRRFRGGGRVVVGAMALVALAGAGAITAKASGATALLLLHGGALIGLAVAWLEARRAQEAAEKASAEMASLSSRILQLELCLFRENAGAPGARAGEVTGDDALARDPRETMASQERELAELKQRLAPPFPTVPSRATDRAPAPARAAHPEPSLLPTARREAAPASAERESVRESPSRADATVRRAQGREGPVGDVEAGRLAAIVQASEADRVELHLQPVVALSRRNVRFYETLARLRLFDDTVLLPHEFLPLLDRLGYGAEFDRRILVRAIAIARHLTARGSEALVSVNLSARTMEDPRFLTSLAALFDASPDTLGRVVVEFPQGREQAEGLAALRDRGVPLALDRVTDLTLEPDTLAGRGVRFAKVPADLLLARSSCGDEAGTRGLAAALGRTGIELVAERVEREEAVPELLDLAVPLAQGFVFAPPRPIRGEVLGAAAPSAPPVVPTRAPAAPGAALEPSRGGHLPARPVLQAR